MESIIEYFLVNHDKLLFVIAGLALVLELTVLGLNGPLLFFSMACVVTGLLVNVGLITTWEFEVFSVGVASILIAIFLWKPLKNFQGPKQVSDSSSDMIGQIVPVSESITKIGGSIRHSGINWQARLDADSELETLECEARVEICGVDGNVMIVKESV